MNLLSEILQLSPNKVLDVAGVGYIEGTPAKHSPSGWPLGIVRRADGDLIVADYKAHRLWRIDKDGMLHTFAGDGIPGNSGDNELAINARINGPHDLAQDNDGNLYFSDLHNYCYRRIDYQTGILTRIAGTSDLGRGGTGENALKAEMDTTSGIAIDHQNNIYLSGEWDNNIRVIDNKTGNISIFAGQEARHYYSEKGLSRPYSGRIKGITFSWELGLGLGGYHGDGGSALKAGFLHPEHLAFDSKGNLYVCDNSNNRIRKINFKTGIITTIFGTGEFSSNGDGGHPNKASLLCPDSLYIDHNDNLYVGEKNGFRIRKVDLKKNTVSTLVGTGLPGWGEENKHATETNCNSPESGIWADPAGTVLWSDSSGRVRKRDGQTGIVATVLGGTHIGDNGPSSKAFLRGPSGIAICPQGQIYFADTWNQRIRKIDPVTATIETIAGNGSRSFGGDNGPAKEASLGSPHDISLNSKGIAIVADTRNGRIRSIDKDNVITTIAGTAFKADIGDGGLSFAASLYHVQSVTHGPTDDIYIGDAIGKIRKIDITNNIISTIGGSGIQGYSGDGEISTKAKIGCPSSIVVDNNNNVYFTDSAFHVIRKIDKDGIIHTLVGTGIPGFSVDRTLANKARIAEPRGLAVSKKGQLFFSDSGNNKIRTVLSDGTLATLVGNDHVKDNKGNQLNLNNPCGMCIFEETTLLFCNNYNNQIGAVKISI